MAWDYTKSAPSAQQPEPLTQCPIPGGYRRAETRHHRIDHPARLREDAQQPDMIAAIPFRHCALRATTGRIGGIEALLRVRAGAQVPRRTADRATDVVGGFGAVVGSKLGSVTASGARARVVVPRAPVGQPPIRAVSMTGNQRARARFFDIMDSKIERHRAANDSFGGCTPAAPPARLGAVAK
jgi:hypothetical protein